MNTENDILIFDKEYYLWKKEKYIGVATYIDDKNVGAEFIKQSISPDGELINEVHRPDKWKFVETT